MTERGDSEIYNFNLTNGGTFARQRKVSRPRDFLIGKPTISTEQRQSMRMGQNQRIFPSTNARNFTVPGGPHFFGVFDNDGNLNLSSGDEGGFSEMAHSVSLRELRLG